MEQSELLLRLAEAMENLAIPYLVTGSMASIAYGEPRFTHDIDVVADMVEGHVSGLKSFFPDDEYYFSEGAARSAIRRKFQFNIIHPASGLKIDVIIPKLDEFDKSRFSRAKRLPVRSGSFAHFASPEDVILKKMAFYHAGGSDKHLRDIDGILRVSGDGLDFKYISYWADRIGVAGVWGRLTRETTSNATGGEAPQE